MKTNLRLPLAFIIFSLSSIGQSFSTLLIDVNNPYMNVFVRYGCTNNQQMKHLGVLEGNYHQGNKWVRHSNNPYFHSPESISFEVVIKNEESEDVNMQRHSFDIFNGPLLFEKVFKEEFVINEKKGEITYKVVVKVIEYPTLVNINSVWTRLDSLDPKSIKIDDLDAKDWNKVIPGYIAIDTLEIKILYAEVDGQEMRLNGNTWREIQKNCTIQESLKQNCVIRCPACGACKECEECKQSDPIIIKEEIIKEQCSAKKGTTKKKKRKKKK